jgi:hypothetical protein
VSDLLVIVPGYRGEGYIYGCFLGRVMQAYSTV